MITPSPDFVSTDLARLHVRRAGTGPPVVLWHSLFFDSRSWGPLVEALARDRTVYTIDGPSHGKSEAVHRDFTYDEIVDSAEQALDRLGLTEPVDWVGNAFGGHVGIHLAARGSRIRTLTTIGTPIQGNTLKEKLTKLWPLTEMYRFLGPIGFLKKQLSDSLLGPEAVAAQPDQARTVIESFATADRDGMVHAMRSMMLRRSTVRGSAAAYHRSNARDVGPRRRHSLAPRRGPPHMCRDSGLPCRGSRGHRPRLTAADRP